MVRRANSKPKGRPTKEQRKIILIAAEGINKTEQTYFSEFNRMQNEYHIVFANGNSTDPVKIIKDAIRTSDNRGIRSEYGDTLYAVFDADFNKQYQIREARKLARKNQVNLIISNPCFEVWLLQRFRFSTRGYHTNDEVITELTSQWPEYRKSISSFQSINDRIEVAIERAKKLEEYHDDVNPQDEIEDRNPATDVYKLVEIIKPNTNKK